MVYFKVRQFPPADMVNTHGLITSLAKFSPADMVNTHGLLPCSAQFPPTDMVNTHGLIPSSARFPHVDMVNTHGFFHAWQRRLSSSAYSVTQPNKAKFFFLITLKRHY